MEAMMEEIYSAQGLRIKINRNTGWVIIDNHEDGMTDAETITAKIHVSLRAIKVMTESADTIIVPDQCSRYAVSIEKRNKV